MGQILHPRHLFESYDISNGDSILIESNSGNASVTVAGEAQDSGNLNDLISRLEGKFKIEINKNVSLFTIRHFDEKSIKKISYKRKLLLEQRTEKTIRLIFSN